MSLFRFPWPYVFVIALSVATFLLIHSWCQPLFEAQMGMEPYSEEWLDIEAELLDYFAYQVLCFLTGAASIVVMVIHWLFRMLGRWRNAVS